MDTYTYATFVVKMFEFEQKSANLVTELGQSHSRRKQVLIRNIRKVKSVKQKVET